MVKALGHTAVCLVAGVLLSCTPIDNQSTRAQSPPPNILFIMIDDLGWMDLGCQGGDGFSTPHIDQLAGEGMRFTDAYAAAPVCSPTRAAAMTGLAPARTLVTNHIPDRWRFYEGKSLGPAKSHNQLDPGHVTIAERLKESGYATAFIGKWHLSGTEWSEENRMYLPENQGFDINIGGNHQGGPGGVGSFFDPYQLPNVENRQPGQYLPDRLAEETIAFMKEQQKAGKPFFICLWNYTVHWPIEAPGAFYAKYAGEKEPTLRQKYQAMVEAMDAAIGQVLSEMEKMGLSQNTLVVFTSDNGPYTGEEDEMTTTHPLRASKGYLYEGGIRVPLIIRWPGQVEKGSLSSQPVITMDFVPTFLEAAGIEFQAGEFDGESLVPLLTRGGTVERDALYFHFPHYAFHRDNHMGGIIRFGDYKLIRQYDTGVNELYNLAEDLGETNNLAEEQPRLAARLQKKLETWLQETHAAMPRPMTEIPEEDLYRRH
jgi:arylsulfatase A